MPTRKMIVTNAETGLDEYVEVETSSRSNRVPVPPSDEGEQIVGELTKTRREWWRLNVKTDLAHAKKVA